MTEEKLKELQNEHKFGENLSWNEQGGLIAALENSQAEVKRLKEALKQCCRMFEWCHKKYGKLVVGLGA